ncbi:hypothetical protein CDL15_Pgr000253 [Punica granatum]|uniref:FBD domain-containing protein n=1 Tax=Punica granatum TaxID=22663 RepID=A0A218Y399_PUNGR|nr:hypothetical protein CDL15_Pgr000253 [Punica granatum]
MGESSVDGMIKGPYSPPRDEGPFMAESFAPRSPPQPAGLEFFLLDINRIPDVNHWDGGPSAVSREFPATVDLLWKEPFSRSESSTSAVIMGPDDLFLRDSPPKKRHRGSKSLHRSEAPVDYLSTLTDELLQHIFSFLPTLDVVRTCTLARRWQRAWKDTWMTSGSLTFSLPPWMHGRLRQFSEIVDRCLKPGSPSKLQKLRLAIPYDRTLRVKLNSWLRAALDRRVEDLALELIRETYKLPEVLYSCASMVDLSLRRCLFGHVEKIDWPFLRVLMLERVELTDAVMNEIFRGSPALEFLKLFSCRGVENIEINSRKMREMVIGYESTIAADVGPHLLVKVSAPYLRVLRLVGDWAAMTLRLLDVQSLVEAELKFLENVHWFDIHSFQMQSSLLKGLLNELKHVDKLTIDHSCLQLVSTFDTCSLSSPPSQNKILILNAKVDRWVISRIAGLLERSCFLEKLVIDMTSLSMSEFPVESLGIPCHDEELYWVLSRELQSLHCLNQCLKRVEIVSFDANSLGSKAVLALIKFLLREAVVLEKMVINVEGSRAKDRAGSVEAGDLWKLFEVTHKIQSYPRVSEGAELVFNYRFKGCSFWMDA